MTSRQPRIIVTQSGDFGRTAAAAFITALERSANPHPLAVLPAGNTPLSLYRELVSMDDVPPFRYLQLDEYAGMDRRDPRLFAQWLDRDVLTPLGINHGDRMIFKPDAADPQEEIDRMRHRILDTGDIDIAVLGLGKNGHVAFNEPGCDMRLDVWLAELAPETRRANAAYWRCSADDIPAHGYTLGIGLLARARQTILLITGGDKAGILQQTLGAPVSAALPATYIQTLENVTVIADDAAASSLQL